MAEEYIEELLDSKRDFSPLLVHLTRDIDGFAAKDALHCILLDKTLQAFNHYCLFSPALKNSGDDLIEKKFRVVCFTETPIDQIDFLLQKIKGRKFKFEPYGLVFKKKYIKEHGGNPVFYTTKTIARPLWPLFQDENGKIIATEEACKLLALVNRYDRRVDFHWEREWRICGDLTFGLNDIYCGLCPEDEISDFESSFQPVKFISPNWGINKILDKLVGKS